MIMSHEHLGEREEERRRNGDRRVTELMSWALLTAPVTMTCREVLALAQARGVHHVPVLDGGVMVGIVCTCDLRGAGEGEPVSRRMHAPVSTIAANASSQEAFATMRRLDVGALPVLYHGFLIGIVTAGDLQRAHVIEESDRPSCSRCGGHHHVRRDARGAPLCTGCEEREA